MQGINNRSLTNIIDAPRKITLLHTMVIKIMDIITLSYTNQKQAANMLLAHYDTPECAAYADEYLDLEDNTKYSAVKEPIVDIIKALDGEFTKIRASTLLNNILNEELSILTRKLGYTLSLSGDINRSLFDIKNDMINLSNNILNNTRKIIDKLATELETNNLAVLYAIRKLNVLIKAEISFLEKETKLEPIQYIGKIKHLIKHAATDLTTYDPFLNEHITLSLDNIVKVFEWYVNISAFNNANIPNTDINIYNTDMSVQLTSTVDNIVPLLLNSKVYQTNTDYTLWISMLIDNMGDVDEIPVHAYDPNAEIASPIHDKFKTYIGMVYSDKVSEDLNNNNIAVTNMLAHLVHASTSILPELYSKLETTAFALKELELKRKETENGYAEYRYTNDFITAYNGLGINPEHTIETLTTLFDNFKKNIGNIINTNILLANVMAKELLAGYMLTTNMSDIFYILNKFMIAMSIIPHDTNE